MRPRGTAVLYADDNADDRFLFEHAYKEAGVKRPLRIVDDGAEVESYLRGEGRYADRKAWPEPALVILDLKMPRRTGQETLEWIRASEDWKALPVLMLSASMHPGDIDKAYASGINAFIVKPTDARDLTRLMGCFSSFWLEFAELPTPGADGA
jgi:CheY-like chemotaxis protein